VTEYIPVGSVVLLSAPAWCMPCRQLQPHWEGLKDEFPTVNFVDIDLGDHPEVAAEHWATIEFNIKGVPSIFFMGGDGPVPLQGRNIIQLSKEIKEIL
jgi:thiol-disulfide isomerase/thioredoxin